MVNAEASPLPAWVPSIFFLGRHRSVVHKSQQQTTDNSNTAAEMACGAFYASLRVLTLVVALLFYAAALELRPCIQLGHIHISHGFD